jgi:AcrR family transcriptional regulator
MRTAGSKGVLTSKAVREAGIQLLARHGYDAMNLRMLARSVGIQAGSLYNHIRSKQDFLFDLLRSIMVEVLATLDERLDKADGPIEQLYALTAFHIEMHCARRDEVFIGNMELRSLTPEHRAIVVDLRSQYEKRIVQILRRGKQEGLFNVEDERIAAFSLISMLTGVSNWYRPDGRRTIQQLIDIHFAMAHKMFGVSAPVDRTSTAPRPARGPAARPPASTRKARAAK